MQHYLYQIQNRALRPWVQYILFNQQGADEAPVVVRSLPNFNICLGLVKSQHWVATDACWKLEPATGITAYLSGVYLQPHCVRVDQALDEICIDFTPSGYHRFFRTPLTTYCHDPELLVENFGEECISFFYQLFEIEDWRQRGAALESFLLHRLTRRSQHSGEAFLTMLEQCTPPNKVAQLAKALHCSERKLQRLFRDQLDLSPKAYLRVRRFRYLLEQLSASDQLESWEALAYRAGYYDYSHFIRDFINFTGLTPGRYLDRARQIEAAVTICIE